MKTNIPISIAAVLSAAGLFWSAATATAQDAAPADNPSAPAPAAAAPQLPYGVPQILQLAQAKVGDDTIIAYIQNSGNSYGLNADQIIYLRQQGLSGPVLTAMLNQPRPGLLAAAASPVSPAPQTDPAPAPQPAAPPPAPAPSSIVGPSVTAIDPTAAAAAASYYYYQPCYSPCYYSYPAYGYYGYYPGVSISLGWGGWHGGGFRGGWRR